MSNEGMPSSTPVRAGPGRAYGGRAAQDRVAARRARFIEAGTEVFGTVGFRSATVRGVCAAAGLTDRYFYESFDSLEALLQAVYLDLMQGLWQGAARLEQRPWPDSPQGQQARLKAAFQLWFNLVREPHFARIVLSEVLGVSPAVDILYERSLREFNVVCTGALVRALQRAGVSASRRALLGAAVAGAAVQVARQWAQDGYQVPRAQVVQTCVLVAWGTVQAALQAQQARAAPT